MITELETLLLHVDQTLLWVDIVEREDEFLGFLSLAVEEAFLDLVLTHFTFKIAFDCRLIAFFN